MNAATSALLEGDMPAELRELLDSPRGVAFEQALDTLVRQREQGLFRALGVLARELHDAVRQLGGDLTQAGGPGSAVDVRHHLNDVLETSAQAAHRSIDFAERMRPEAESLAYNAGEVLAWTHGNDAATVLARQAVDFALSCRDGLADMVLAQSWRDLSGQRTQRVMGFIERVESSLLELLRLTGALAGGGAPVAVPKDDSQDQADSLLSEF